MTGLPVMSIVGGGVILFNLEPEALALMVAPLFLAMAVTGARLLGTADPARPVKLSIADACRGVA